MKRCFAHSVFVALAVLGIASFASPAAAQVTWEGKVDGMTRTALVFPGTDALNTPSPLVLLFHGSDFGARWFSEWPKAPVHLAWPEATVVYPQGTDVSAPWQVSPGERDDRDLHFVDALLKDLAATYKVDERRVFASGASYGAFFVNLLLTMRPEPFAAFAPLATPDSPVGSGRGCRARC